MGGFYCVDNVFAGVACVCDYGNFFVLVKDGKENWVKGLMRFFISGNF